MILLNLLHLSIANEITITYEELIEMKEEERLQIQIAKLTYYLDKKQDSIKEEKLNEHNMLLPLNERNNSSSIKENLISIFKQNESKFQEYQKDIKTEKGVCKSVLEHCNKIMPSFEIFFKAHDIFNAKSLKGIHLLYFKKYPFVFSN
ncbi:hypothetical protein A0H76_2561 [Hepatospora eriocheir]|uniref:Uncharacterized protein n=1 Tax=Hepatospora eriocheir TaxID=1081669 RepID=A0A1X0QFA4_9MICR|nr:hypothetical protein A0H76_2561 [Hepatospora eriocheir]